MHRERTDREHSGHIKAMALLDAEEGVLLEAGRSRCFLEIKGSHCSNMAFKGS